MPPNRIRFRSPNGNLSGWEVGSPDGRRKSEPDQILLPTPPSLEMHFIPNPNQKDFLQAIGLDLVAQSVLRDKTIESRPCAPYRCVQCETDFTPVWKAVGPKGKELTDSTEDPERLLCESCFRNNQTKAMKEAEHTNQLKEAIVKVVEQEHKIEQQQIQEGPGGHNQQQQVQPQRQQQQKQAHHQGQLHQQPQQPSNAGRGRGGRCRNPQITFSVPHHQQDHQHINVSQHHHRISHHSHSSDGGNQSVLNGSHNRSSSNNSRIGMGSGTGGGQQGSPCAAAAVAALNNKAAAAQLNQGIPKAGGSAGPLAGLRNMAGMPFMNMGCSPPCNPAMLVSTTPAVAAQAQAAMMNPTLSAAALSGGALHGAMPGHGLGEIFQLLLHQQRRLDQLLSQQSVRRDMMPPNNPRDGGGRNK